MTITLHWWLIPPALIYLAWWLIKPPSRRYRPADVPSSWRVAGAFGLFLAAILICVGRGLS